MILTRLYQAYEWRERYYRKEYQDWRATIYIGWTPPVRAFVTPRLSMIWGSGCGLRIGRFRWGRSPGGRWKRLRF